MRNLFSLTAVKKAFAFAGAHKIMSAIIVFAVLGGGYWTYNTFASSDGETRYVLGTVERGTVIAAVSASGQVSASNQLDIQAKASGEITSINVSPGQKVVAGALIAALDPTDAQKTVRDAQANLESAQLSLEKLQKPADSLSLTQAQNTLSKAQESKQNAEDDLEQSYDDGFNDISNAFLDLPAVMTGLEDVLYGDDTSQNQDNLNFYTDAIKATNNATLRFKADVEAKYTAARTAYDRNFNDYKAASRFSDVAVIEGLINQTYDTTKKIADAVKSANDLIQLYQDEFTKRNLTPSPLSTTHIAALGAYTGTTNSHLSSLLSAKNTIKTSKDTIVNSDRTITENTGSLEKLKAGADDIDLRSSQLSVTKAQNALRDAQNNLDDYYVRAPFAGTIAAVNIKKFDSAGSGTAIATLVTSQKIAELSLNEVDAAKVSIGDKATLTFDAIEGLTLTGAVAEVSTIGAVTQGVVSYTVKIGFDSQDERIKSGMTANASIQTDVRQDVLAVPSSAVKTQNGVSYVQVFNPPLSETGGAQGVVSNSAPRQVEVTVGISDDTKVEILSGIEEGQQIVTRTISGTATSNVTTNGGATNRGGGLGGPGVIRF
ncbi:hypothetical protein A2704_05490 [Candidatus Kaiserbacteria bacterium RIFCSPHIGHO2_01_FULL_54_36b]|uniref:YknX-like beta-barrel domain-containing protein n=1 Tax=Candidatus Kaiserbacteria bacterium RIFCSPHIGHO2_01_FULL_54_36b TaxID=1798483 RepID=A0A1F6CMS5_9BACT|nr:MAG: hypothetical protein A2704_05490 [Candidatus Kaiserbacteria bacterium RIFCSPHIGHO2_01_FULL_54_36b]